MKVYDGSSWDLVAPDTSNFIDKSILTAKGSLISASTASTPVALTAAATDGYILSVSAAATSGLAWIAPNPGDITGITASSPLTGGGTSGDVTVGIQDGTTAQKGAVQLEDSTASTSTTNAATPNSVKSAYDLANTANTAASSAQTTANAAVPKSTIDAKGDLIVGSADDTVVKLTAGTNGLYLAADSSTTSGLVWTTVVTPPKNNSVYIPVSSTTPRTLTYSFTTGIYNVSLEGPVLSFTVGSTIVSAHPDDIASTVTGYMVNLPSASSASISLTTAWTTRNVNQTSTIRSFTYGNGLYVAGGNQAAISTSTDGISWTTRLVIATTSTQINGLAYGAGVYVSVGSNTHNKSSTDGITWTTRAGGDSSFNDVIFADNLFVAAGSNTGGTSPNLWTSTDGITWTTRAISGGMRIVRGLTFGNGLYVAGGELQVVASVDEPAIKTSTNGITWTTRTVSFGGSSIQSVTFGNGLFVAGGTQGAISSSTDGITWTQRTSGFGTSTVQSVAYGNNYYVAAGSSGIMTSSTDAITWTLRNPNFGTTNISVVEYINDKFYAGGNVGIVTSHFGNTAGTAEDAFVNWNQTETVALN
jgi:hypothetical protein